MALRDQIALVRDKSTLENDKLPRLRDKPTTSPKNKKDVTIIWDICLINVYQSAL